ncbi:unnamed protein product [Paramecium primaurelia]|uniref:IBR domain protein n=1 Tax=Paramecium primaurelia TaxID=5886 RepID=A0A8S1NEB3_PARPR|nr:unnamed protein product [Paramecium primaurelia]
MLEIRNLKQLNKLKLVNQNEDDLMISSFILGYLQGKSNSISLELFQQNLDVFTSLNAFMSQKFCSQERIYRLYNDALLGSKDFQTLCYDLESEVLNSFEGEQIQETQSFILQIPSDIQSQIILQPQQNQDRNSINNSEWELEQKNSSIIKINTLLKNYNNESDIYELKQKLQKEFEEYQYIQALNFKLNSQNFSLIIDEDKYKQIDCQICLEKIVFKEMAPLYCQHIFHQKCLNQYCVHQMGDKKIPIKCPSQCNQTIIYQDLIEVLDQKQLSEFQQLSFKAYVQSLGNQYSWCPTPNCTYVFIVEKSFQLDCPVCQKKYCLECKIEYHNGFSCKEYQEKQKTQSRQKNEKYFDDRFYSFIKGAKFKQCPQCKYWVEKSQGCNHMTCLCKFQFCYVCGGVYNKCECKKNKFWRFNFF